MTASLAEQLGYDIDLSNPAWVHELRDPHTGKWIDSPGDVAFPLPKPGRTGSVDRYKVPDPARLREVKSGYRDPADHPFWREHPISPENIVAAYDASDAGAREQGRRWYSDVSDLANKITGGEPEKGGILLSAYSPQTSWPINMFNAAESARRGHAIGPGEGIKVTTQQKDKAQKALDGQGIDTLMTTAKTHSFGALIRDGDDAPTDPYGHVVVDTHAVNVALGGTMRGKALEKAPINDARQHEYVADQYRAAAKIISQREGRLMKPHQLQAITWLAQQRVNQALDAAGMSPTQRGRATMTKNAWKRWMAYADEHGIPVVIGSTGIELAYQVLLADVIELVGEDSLIAMLLEPRPFDGELSQASGIIGSMADSIGQQVIDLFNPDEPRGPDGRWILTSLNPTGSLFTEYNPKSRATAQLGPNLTTLAETQGVHPSTPLRVYRGAPPEQKSIVPGDYITDDPQLARDYAGTSKVLSLDVTYGDVLDDRTEPGGGEYIYRPRSYPLIGPEHARGDSRAVSHDEFQALAREGNRWIDQAKNHSAPITGLDGPGWDRVKARAYASARQSWGGETIDTDTGDPLPQGADLYALSVKPRGMDTVSVPEHATEAEFGAAMDRAKELFRPALERRSFYLGVFHDDDLHRIDIDPVAIVDSVDKVERVGAYTRAVGGAYHFKSGDGFWPPHVAEGAGMANDDNDTHFEHGYSEWHTQAVAAQDPEPGDDTPDED